ncbi:hypothetical protein MRB53_008655 [Persea americana]|uniref:Uncharacterized protein n=1 Tax=Persea americana TaxID=3435 RepID=A0ACC2MPX8_PERAE|nr:hypothetical protein MRB53_008655 [Persea americana]|eukprot:TRINITY_DN3420_c2_g1_i1.p1 TRINITY_DN3420_c2_g1~~TRINITY_DN3420_c2_g1_i1.p1  ORF type:complete len:365 (+),score=69.75 TRINITY_DN3420_c2_g1_i1:88-1095(+)
MAMASSSSSSSADPSPPLHPTSSNPHPPSIPNPQNPTVHPLPSNPPRPTTSSSSQPLKSPNPPPPPPPPISFPVSASGRGFPPKAVRPSSPPSDRRATITNPIGYTMSTGRTPALAGTPSQGRPFGLQSDHQQQAAVQSVQAMRPPLRQTGNMSSGALRGAPAAPSHPRVTQFPTISSASDYNFFKDLRDKSRDDTVVTIHDRKVRLSDTGSGSFYALCRSWVQNGLPQDNLPQVGEGIRFLPRPFPATVAHSSTSRKDQVDDEDESARKEEHDGSVENLSARDLLEGHKKRAKKVRARLREERLQRIDRYRQRLSLLIPSPSMEQCRNDAATGS